MEAKFLTAWQTARQEAGLRGARLRPITPTLADAHRMLSGSRCSDGFEALADRGLLKLSLEALVVDRRFTALFSDREADRALERLLSAGYRF